MEDEKNIDKEMFLTVKKLVTVFQNDVHIKIVDELNKCVVKHEFGLHIDEKMLEEMFLMYENRPLKLEELEEGMWVWDNHMKEYSLIKRIYSEYDNYFVAMLQDEKDFECVGRLFEKDRFYRYEVKEREEEI